MENTNSNIDRLDFSLPEWHKEIIESRLKDIEENPQRIKPISEFVIELDLTVVNNIKNNKT